MANFHKSLLFSLLSTAAVFFAFVSSVELERSNITKTRNAALHLQNSYNPRPALQPQLQQQRAHIKILLFAMSAHNGTLERNVPVYELNAGALSLALQQAQVSGLIDPRTTEVELVYRDGMSGNVTRMMEDLLEMNATPGGFQVLLGPAMSAAARTIGIAATAMRRLNIVWGTTSPELSDRTVYPNVIRPQPSYYVISQCLQRFFISQNMTNNLAVLYVDEQTACAYMVSSLRQTVRNYNITVTNYAILPNNFTDEQLALKLRQISFESRIILGCGMFEPANLNRTIQLYRIVAEAKKLGMTDSSYQWILYLTDLSLPQYHPLYGPRGRMPSPAEILLQNKIQLTEAELVEAMKHFLYTYHRMTNRGDVVWRQNVLDALADPPWNENTTRVRADLQALGVDPNNSPAYRSGHLADSLTLYLMGLQRARAAGVDYENPYIMYDILRNITFEGHSGYFALNRDGERLPDLSLHGPASDYDSKSLAEKFEDKGNMRCSKDENIRSDSNNISGKLELDRPFVWYTTNGLPPPSVPACGYRGELCGSNPLHIILIVAGGVAVLGSLAGTATWLLLRQRRKTELLRMDWLLQPTQIREKHSAFAPTFNGLASASESNSRSSSKTTNSSSERRRSVVANYDAMVMWNNNDRSFDSMSENHLDTSEAESLSSAATASHYSVIKNTVARATYQNAQITLFKWPWTPGSGSSNASRARSSFSAKNKAAVAAETTKITSLTAHVLEHRECLHELLAMRRMNHDNVCAFVGAYYDAELRQLVFAYTYCHKGTLRRVLHRHSQNRQSHQPLAWFFKQSILLDIALGLDYLQNSTQLEFHGRLSSDYVVIDSRWVTKLTGFGRWSFGIEHPEDFLQLESADEDEVESYRRRLLWTAPEILRQPGIVDGITGSSFRTYNYGGGAATKREAAAAMKRADVYSFGIMMSEVIYNIEPFSERLLSNGHEMKPSEIVREMIRGVRKNEAPLRPLSDKESALESISTEDDAAAINSCRRLMVNCWAEDYAKRPMIKQVCHELRAQARARGTGSLVDTVIAKLEIYAKDLESLVQARTNDLQEEKRRADGLLLRLLPESVAEQLKRGEPIVPQMYESASVYFSDIVSFTSIASLLTPLAVVDLLNKVFMYMDDVLSRYAVYKMETIGDGYMVVSGLPKRISTHAAELASMAIDIRNGISSVKIESVQQQQEPYRLIRIRLGLHSGPVVAGVVGLTMPRYCLFGDTVNVASRMESQGESMQIQISESTRQLLGFEYISRDRGQVKIKGKGLMHTYWLDDGPVRHYAPSSINVHK